MIMARSILIIAAQWKKMKQILNKKYLNWGKLEKRTKKLRIICVNPNIKARKQF